MPCCCVVGCSLRSELGIRLFLLPKGERNRIRREQWIHNIGRKQLPKNAYVCEKHFTHDQFENNRLDNKRLLRWNAIPTIFSHVPVRNPPKETLMIDKGQDVQDSRSTAETAASSTLPEEIPKSEGFIRFFCDTVLQDDEITNS